MAPGIVSCLAQCPTKDWFMKKLDKTLEAQLPKVSTKCKALKFVEKHLIGEFIEICYFPHQTNSWISRSWKSLIKGQVNHYSCEFAFFVFILELKED